MALFWLFVTFRVRKSTSQNDATLFVLTWDQERCHKPRRERDVPIQPQWVSDSENGLLQHHTHMSLPDYLPDRPID